MVVSTPMDAQRSPGRPRDTDADKRILDACFAVMAQVGYVRMSVLDVARRAGVTRPTVYRRWPTKEELAVAALDHEQAGIVHLPHTGDLQADLVAHLRSLQQTLTRPFGMAVIGTMLAEEFTTPELLAGFRQRVVPLRRGLIREVFLKARDNEAIAAEADLDVLVDLVVGACYAHYISGAVFDDGWAESISVAVIRAGGPAN